MKFSPLKELGNSKPKENFRFFFFISKINNGSDERLLYHVKKKKECLFSSYIYYKGRPIYKPDTHESKRKRNQISTLIHSYTPMIL